MASREERRSRLEEELKGNMSEKEKMRLLIEKGYRRGLFDTTETARLLQEILGEMTGGTYKPHLKLSVRTDSGIYRIPVGENDEDLAKAIYYRIIANDPGYKRWCEFHFKEGSTKHHSKGLKARKAS
ncbi:MAG: hypothetical protein N3D20_01035 [Candidatus Pacearchaeota archaeon]|nr:hypothetical protein [Candidatus Pacearchaeota archaeon]